MIGKPIHSDNFGGIAAIRIAVIGQPDEAVYFTLETAVYSASRQQSENGPFTEHRLSFTIPNYRDDVTAWLEDKSLAKLSATITFVNENVLPIGSPSYPLRLADESTSGARVADFNSYQINLISRTPIL